MKIQLLVSAVVLSFGASMVAMDKFDINSLILPPEVEYTIAQEWEDVESCKDPVYLPFFEKFGYKDDYLEERWGILKKFFGTTIPTMAILHKAKEKQQEKVGFLTLQYSGVSTLVYTSPCLLPFNQIDQLAQEVTTDIFPKTEMAYCIVNADNKQIAEALKKENWYKLDKSPIEPNKEFIGDTPISIFAKSYKCPQFACGIMPMSRKGDGSLN